MKVSIRSTLFSSLALLAGAWTSTARATDLVISTYAGNDVVTVPFPAGSPLATLVTSGSGGVSQPNALTYGPDGYIYVASTVTNDVKRYYADGSFDPAFTWPTIAGFAGPSDVLFDPADGTLLVSGINCGRIIRLNVTTGIWSDLITAFADGLGRPGYMCFHPVTGKLLVADYQNDTVLEYCNNGTFELCTFVTAGLGGLDGPENMVWRANELYVVSYNSNQVLRYDASGAFIDVVAPTGAEVPAASAFHGLAFGSDGKLYTGDRTNTRVLKYSITPTVASSSVFGGVFATGMDTADLEFHTPKKASFPLVHGEVVTTFCPDLVGGGVPNPAGYCVKVVDPRGNGPLGRNWLAPMFSNEDAANPADVWNFANLGPVFGCCLDHQGNIFVAATSAYGAFPLALYPSGPGAVYKINRLTGAITTWLGTLAVPSVPTALAPGLTSLPNTGPGLGDICYDPFYDQFFVTNLEDGKIYRVKDTGATGIVLSALDPFGNDDAAPTPGFVPLGERVYAVHKLNGRILLWSGWLRDSGPGGRQATPWPAAWPPLPSSEVPNNAVFMSLTVPNNFFGSTLVKVMPWLSATAQYSNPVTDITDSEESAGAFMNASRILCAERTYFGDVGMINIGASAHRSRVLEFTEAPGYPASANHFHVGQPAAILPTPTNAAGGIAYETDDDVWATGDALIADAAHFNLVYGLQSIPSTGNDFSPETAQSHLIDLDHMTEYYDKSQCGDVEFVEHTTWYWKKYVVTCAGDMFGLCPCSFVGFPDHGCPSSLNPEGAILFGDGNPSASADTFVLQSSGTPNGPVLFFQATTTVNGISGMAFGDGQLCIGGSIVRLGVKFAAGGEAQFPGMGNPPLSVFGLPPLPGEWRHYQGWYRDASGGFCSPSTFNLTNAIAVQWTP